MLILLCFHVEEEKQIYAVSILFTNYWITGSKKKILSFEVFDFYKAMWEWTRCDVHASQDIRFLLSMISSSGRDRSRQM